MNFLVFFFIMANIAFCALKMASDASPGIKLQYRLAFMFTARLIPLLAYVASVGIFLLNYLTLANPGLLGVSNALHLARQENLFLLFVSAFLLTPAGPVIAASVLFHLALRMSLLHFDGVSVDHALYFVLMGCLSLILISIDKFTADGGSWLRSMQVRIRGLVLYLLALATLLALILLTQDPEALRTAMKLPRSLNMTYVVLATAAIMIIGWYQILVSRRNKDMLLLLVVPSVMLIAIGLDIDRVHLVFPLFTMLGLAICMHDDYCRQRFAAARKADVMSAMGFKRVRATRRVRSPSKGQPVAKAKPALHGRVRPHRPW